ncbi:hypothetical protein COO91_00694 [Nostoc flagelliforme CCNUN1]|uniref:Uncharacterized protein n=1 Tax=Nostoc flagelliforme CCNUN1 TaxID=2038116 RepID=A0A2K8SHD4_9NOSO|nr:hypothetical protein COO91_00694 [Nostoc flagelliforme CCNUN1]
MSIQQLVNKNALITIIKNFRKTLDFRFKVLDGKFKSKVQNPECLNLGVS